MALAGAIGIGKGEVLLQGVKRGRELQRAAVFQQIFRYGNEGRGRQDVVVDEKINRILGRG